MNDRYTIRLNFLNKGLCRWLILFSLLVTAQTSIADVVNVSGTTSRNQIQDGQAATVAITWAGSTTNTGGVTVFSNAGAFTDQGGGSLGVNNRRISRTLNIPAVNIFPFTIIENLQIPESIIYTAKKRGSLLFAYTRTFDDGSGVTDTVTVTFQIISSAGGQLSISRVDLRFDNDQVVRVENIFAIANINYNGVGLFDLAWEIATPASTQGTPFFSTLRNERSYLGAGREAYIQSPLLPTLQTGTYILRLNILSPVTAFDPVEIRYSVIKSDKGMEPIDIGKIRLSTPLPKAVLSKDTKFNWQPVEGANAYQLEIYDYIENPGAVRSLEDIEIRLDWKQDKGTRSTGLLVPGSKYVLSLSPLSRQHLNSGHTYRWRVIAINAQGQIIASSQLRTLLVP